MRGNRRSLAHRVLVAVSFGVVLVPLSQAQEPGALPNPSPFNYTRTSSFGYDTTTGLLTNETVEPNIASVCASTSYTPDAYGNRGSKTTQNCTGASGDALFATRKTTVSYTNSAGQAGIVNGQYPYTTTTTTDAAGHQTTVTRQFDGRFGSVTSETLASSPGNLATTTSYDGFGRKVQETRADGSYTKWSYDYCAGLDPNGGTGVQCPSTAVGTSNVMLVTRMTQTPYGPNNAQNGPAVRVYQDTLGRDVLTQTQSAVGTGAQAWVLAWVVYDTQGRVAQKSEPYFDGDTPTVAFSTLTMTTTYYDLLGRPTSVQRPDAAAMAAVGASSSVATTTIQYTDLVVTTTSPPTVNNPQGQTTAQTRDSQGRVIKVVDANGGVLVHQYDAFGNVVMSVDQYGNTVKAFFDLRGRKYQTNDPDMGQWTYGYDALGEMVWQQSPNELAAGAQVKTSYTYDALGRMVTRTLPEYTTRWSYDTYAGGTACPDGTLRLCEVSVANPTTGNLDRKYTYDIDGRPLSDTLIVTSGPTFVSSVTYDPGSALVATRTYPTGLQVSYGYSPSGYLDLVTSAGATLWQATSVNARNQIELQGYGNGVQTTEKFDPQTGRLVSIQSQLASQAAGALVNLAFSWDPLSNLMSRSDANGDGAGVAATDTFGYDSLNRLTTDIVASAAIAGGSRTVRVSYNDIGNILSKSDVAGNYAYGTSGTGSVGPHAVLQVGANTYHYDGNGNAISASGALWQAVTYTSFNLPNDSATGGLYGPNGVRYTWRYGANLERVREDRISGTGTRTTWFLHPDNAGGLSFEQETAENGTVTNRHYVTAAGRVVAVLVTTGVGSAVVTQTDYWHVDQIGSLVAVTGGGANLVERYAYDPFGKRRFPDGNFDVANALYIDATHYVDQLPTLALLTTTRGTVRGFTGHEHLDDLGLIHMNGRLYDAAMGRFMQADPTVQYVLLMQDYNRYSYLMNNPLNGADPSGYTFFLATLFNDTVGQMVDGLLGWMPSWLREIAAIAVAAAEMAYGMPPDPSIWQQLAVSAAAGFDAGVIATGTLQGGIQGAISAALFNGAGTLAGLSPFLPRGVNAVALHAVAGCLSSMMQGGDCGKGALGAAATEALGSLIPGKLSGNRALNTFEHVVAYSVIGGTASTLSGGKFANGAMTGAFQYLFNRGAHEMHDFVVSILQTEPDADGIGPEYHWYQTDPLMICSFSSGSSCTFDNVHAAVMATQVPGYFGTTVDGGIYPVRIPVMGYIGDVQVSDNGSTVLNETLSNQLLYYGYVERTITVTSQGIYLQTFGEGANLSAAAAAANQAFGRGLFTGQQTLTKQYFDQHFGQ
jgi:RHS repeat-associated protein